MPQLSSLPTLPIRRNWDSTESSTALVDTADYGNDKVKQYRRATVVKTDLSAVDIEVSITNRDDVYNFLVSRVGKPFLLQDSPNKAWRCVEFSFTWTSPGLWMFNGEITEVGGKWT